PSLRPRMTAVAMLAMATALAIESVATGPVLLGIGVALFFPSTGVATNLAEGALVDAAPERAERTMARWSLFQIAGDVCAPFAIFLGALSPYGWRAAALGVALILFAWAPLSFLAQRRVSPRATDHDSNDSNDSNDNNDDNDDTGGETWRSAARVVLHNRALLVWLFGAALCTLLDETVVALLGLAGHERYGEHLSATLIIAAFCAGGAVGVVVVERLLKARSGVHLLAVSCALCALSFGALVWFVGAPSYAAVGMALVAGAFSAPLYPLAKAQAYLALPGRSAAVNAAAAIFGVVDVVAPLGIGALVDGPGVNTALAVLLLQPLGLLVLALAAIVINARARP
ncbi:MAG TPA: MFS transporter, partial [Myxococcota bacterium]